MKTYAVLLRGINVGGRNTLPMAELRTLLQALGCEHVQTYIQSGNVILRSTATSAALSQEIAQAIHERHGFEPHVLVLAASEVTAAMDANPFAEHASDPKSVHFGFLDSVPPNSDLDGLEAIRAPSERFELKERVFYLHAPDGIGRSKLAARSEALLGVPMTDRNLRTMSKIVTMLNG
ncbi:DUF1697 domain-containing protein [uncultured Abyssibacter sp.]|uniref:DUF1697 domain-containing protein n=1 Tax=uncultured Abyssibacter sp. TaxID=2320202 RepID=UPI0032B21B1D